MNYFARFIGLIAVSILVVSMSCGGGQGGGESKQTTVNDLSAIGVAPDISWHDDKSTGYVIGQHADMTCNECHLADDGATVIDDSAICYDCHTEDYTSSRLPEHITYNISTQCETCHYSDSFTTRVRIDYSLFHDVITTECEKCHTSRTPSTHTAEGNGGNCARCHVYSAGLWGITADGKAHKFTTDCSSCHTSSALSSHKNYYTTCETCHTYPDWNRVSFGHAGISSGCNQCHSRHYNGYQCEWCHTSGISWKFVHDDVKSQGCTACHGAENRYHGTVYTDANGTTPSAGVTVTINDIGGAITVTTGSDGTFSATGTPSAGYTASIGKNTMSEAPDIGDCSACHGVSVEPLYSGGNTYFGTVYTDATGTTPRSGARVTIYDAGGTINLTTGSDGAFATTEGDPSAGYTASIDGVEMPIRPTSGSCGSCHGRSYPPLH